MFQNPDEKLAGFIAEYLEQEMNCKSTNDISNNILHVPGEKSNRGMKPEQRKALFVTGGNIFLLNL